MEGKRKTSVLYLAMYDAKMAPGVHKKVTGFIEGVNDLGYSGKVKNIRPEGFGSYLKFVLALWSARPSAVVVRYLSRLGLAFFMAGIILRMRGSKLYIDIPTPIINLRREILSKNNRSATDWLDILMISLLGSIPFLTAERIIQYSSEGKYFSIGVKNRTLKIGNGINVSKVPQRVHTPKWPGNTLNLIAVGTVAYWHGLDRMIKAIKILNENTETGYSVNMNIVGEGPGKADLELFVNESSMGDSINFSGMLYGDDLFEQYRDIHFGVGSLGWFRSGVEEASPLKNREYLAAGIPVISATKDPDFIGESKYYRLVSNDESIESIVKLLKQIGNCSIPTSKECRDYATTNLDFRVKIDRILQFNKNLN